MMASILQPLNQESGQLTPPRYSFREYVEDVFLPVHRRKWKESTRATSEHTIGRHLLPTLGDRRLSEIGREDLQLLLDSKACTHSASVVAHLRWHLSAIFRMALSDGAISVNPSPGLFTPACRPEKPRLVMSVSEIQRALDVLPLRERLMFRMAVFAGMRPGEILALRVGNVEDGVVHIEQRVYQGKLDSPKGRKGKRTARTIALPPGTAAELRSWREKFAEPAPEAFLFPSERGTPLTRENVWRRNMLPRQLETIGLEWAGFQVMRRTNASLRGRPTSTTRSPQTSAGTVWG
ncbi:MAG: tyrosine-type recombinase/integrase [Bryobacterales bacterium]